MAAAGASLRAVVRFSCHAVREGDHVDESRRRGLQFARVVAVSDAPAVRSAVLLRLVLINGRRAELEIGDVPQLGEVLDMLERRA